MPKAKRNKLVSLTQTKPKMRDHKEAIVQKAQSYLHKFKESQTQSKFLMGKNKVIGVAFGTQQQNSYKPNSYLVSKLLYGHCVVFFTNKKHHQVQQIFDKFEQQQFATGGTIADQTIILQKGFKTLQNFSHSIESHLRELGLPTRLVNSKIQLMGDYVVSQQGKPLKVNQCKLLRLLGHKMSRLKFQIRGWYDGNKVHK